MEGSSEMAGSTVSRPSAREAIDLLLRPKSIAFVGASSDATKQSGQPVRNVLAAGYGGKVYAVNRRGEPVDMVPTCRTIAEIPEPVDIGFVTVPAAQCAGAIEALGARGARAAVIAVGGFAETGSETGTRLSRQIEASARESGVRLVGPVCNGLYSTSARLALGYNAIHQRALQPGSVAFVSHSGALAGTFVTLLEAAGSGISAYISAGSEVDLGLADFIDYFAGDDQTRVIGLLLDHVGDGAKFLAAVRSARRAGKSVVALKLGDTALGRAATLAHSSHLAGERSIYEAVFEAEGIRSVPSVECLAITCALLAQGRYRSSGGVMGTSSSGGGAIMLADLLTREGICVPALSAQTLVDIGGRLRFDAARIMNPFDLGLGGRQYYHANVASLARDPAAAVLIAFGTPVPQLQSAEQHAHFAIATVDAARENPDLPVLYLSPAPLFDDEKRILREGNVPVCGSTLDAVAIAKALMPVAPAGDAEAFAIAGGAFASAHRGALSEHRSKSLLRSHSMPFPQEILARELDAVLEAAERVGYPLVLKASGDGIWHKSEHKLVELAIDSPAALRAAWERLEQRVVQIPGVALEGYLLAPYIDDGIEAFVGFIRDPEFGPVAVIGPGGVQAELYGQAAMCHLPLPLTPAKVSKAVEMSALGKLAGGYRGGARVDVEAFVRLVVEAARIVVALGPGLKELDLNPVRIRTAGQGAWPLDALCVFDD
jgi:acetate---CoA ligase (ADP-forming)